jgi:hypothetical protein
LCKPIEGRSITNLRGFEGGERVPQGRTRASPRRGAWGEGGGQYVRTARAVGELLARRCVLAYWGCSPSPAASFPPSLLERAWRLPVAVSRAGGCVPGIGCSASVDARVRPRFSSIGARPRDGLWSTTANKPRGGHVVARLSRPAGGGSHCWPAIWHTVDGRCLRTEAPQTSPARPRAAREREQLSRSNSLT